MTLLGELVKWRERRLTVSRHEHTLSQEGLEDDSPISEVRCFKFLEEYPLKNNMTIKHPPSGDVCPIENGDFPMSC